MRSQKEGSIFEAGEKFSLDTKSAGTFVSDFSDSKIVNTAFAYKLPNLGCFVIAA